MTDPFASYIKQVDRALDLPRRQKKELLCGFQAELKERFSDIPNEKTLLADIGRPEEVAYTLLEAVDVKEHTRFNSIPYPLALLHHRCARSISDFEHWVIRLLRFDPNRSCRSDHR